jgi:hypothetical protein
VKTEIQRWWLKILEIPRWWFLQSPLLEENLLLFLTNRSDAALVRPFIPPPSKLIFRNHRFRDDPPEIVEGALPDSIVLSGGNTRIDLSDAAFDIDGDELMWSGEAEGGVQVAIEEDASAQVFASLDWVGEAVVVLRVSDLSGGAAWHSVRVIRTQTLNDLPGDFDGDGEVGFPDFLSFVQAFGQTNPSLEADLNGDGKVDFGDFLVLVQNFGRKAE